MFESLEPVIYTLEFRSQSLIRPHGSPIMIRLKIVRRLAWSGAKKKISRRLLVEKCEKRRHFWQKNSNDNHRCAVKTEIMGKRRGTGKDRLMPLQKGYKFKADGMN